MNVLIPYEWLKEILITDATPEDIQKYVSLSGPSIEKIIYRDNEPVLDLEITSNRIDSASIIGFARECSAILPRYNFKAEFKPPKSIIINDKYYSKEKNKLNIVISNTNLCSRFTALVFDQVKISESPKYIKEKLKLCGIQPINNIVDVSNYLMILFGQPVHMFDYEKISNSLLHLRLSKNGERIVTLDKEEILLQGNDLVIEDGKNRLIDLCGIMGGLNSAITEDTKKIIFFLQTYNKASIRRTSMLTGKRTMASSFFEKGIDEKLIDDTLNYGIDLITNLSKGKIASEIYDIYPSKYEVKNIKVKISDIYKMLDIKITNNEIKNILISLGFIPTLNKNILSIGIPSFRSKDISIKEDIVEEIARIYGYHNIPNQILPFAYVKQPVKDERYINIINTARDFLKSIGAIETMSYSMYSMDDIQKFDLSIQENIKIKNAMTKDIEFLRESLIPSLLKVYQKNTSAGFDISLLYEIAKIYKKEKKEIVETDLLTLVSDKTFNETKSYVEKLLNLFEVKNYTLNIIKDLKQYDVKTQIKFASINKKLYFARMGILSKKTLSKFNVNKNITVIEIFLNEIVKNEPSIKLYSSFFPTAKVNLEVTIKKDILYSELIDIFNKRINKHKDVIITYSYKSIYENWLSFKFTFQSKYINITQEESLKLMEEITKDFEIKR